MIKLSQLEYQIVVILCESELFGTNIEKYREISNLSNTEFVKAVFETYLQNNWDCNLSELHKRTDYLNGLPCELIPNELFRAAMQDAVKQINWDAIAQDEDIMEKINFLKSN
jgi:hypothetical protein